MANDFTSNPFILDTAGATDLLVPTAGARIQVSKLRWVVGTGGAANDTISVTDSAGKEKWSSFHTVTAATTAEEDTESDFFPAIDMLGLKLPTMTRGKLYVYLDIGG
jgi:hypothetical protein